MSVSNHIRYFKRGNVVASQSPIVGASGNDGRTVLVEYSDGRPPQRASCGWFTSSRTSWVEVHSSEWTMATQAGKAGE